MVLDGKPVSRWWAVTFHQPRQLIGDGYFATVEDAALACHRQFVIDRGPKHQGYPDMDMTVFTQDESSGLRS